MKGYKTSRGNQYQLETYGEDVDIAKAKRLGDAIVMMSKNGTREVKVTKKNGDPFEKSGFMSPKNILGSVFSSLRYDAEYNFTPPTFEVEIILHKYGQ